MPLTLVLWGLLLFANPFPTYAQAIRLDIVPTPSLLGIPLLVLLYPVCVLLSIGLSIDALLRPGPARRMMGDLARQRAQPWLLATSAIHAAGRRVGGVGDAASRHLLRGMARLHLEWMKSSVSPTPIW